MRKVLTFALAAAIATSTAPLAMAQSAISAGSLAGRAVDAAGRGVSGQRVELLRGSLVISTDTTDSRGEWLFRSVAPGDYIVRMNVRGRIAGVRISVGLGQAVTGTLVVVPTASVSPQLGTFASLLTIVPSAATAVTATAVVAQTEVDTTVVDETILMTILQRLDPDAREAFVEDILEAIENDEAGSGGYEQYVEQFEQILEDPDAEIPTFDPPVEVS